LVWQIIEKRHVESVANINNVEKLGHLLGMALKLEAIDAPNARLLCDYPRDISVTCRAELSLVHMSL
jgi:hypothetical protein